MKPSLFWHNKKVRGDMFLKATCPSSIKGTTEGWSSQETFLEWVEKVLVAETQPLHNRHNCMLLLIDGCKTCGIGSISVRKSHCHVFLGGLDPGQAPLKTLLLMLRLT